MTFYEGGCHCGAVRYRVTVREAKAVECNCSICSKKGFIHVIVDEADFNLVRGHDNLTTYTFGTHTAKHHFCTTCGIHSFYRPRSHPDAIDVNLRSIANSKAVSALRGTRHNIWHRAIRFSKCAQWAKRPANKRRRGTHLRPEGLETTQPSLKGRTGPMARPSRRARLASPGVVQLRRCSRGRELDRV